MGIFSISLPRNLVSLSFCFWTVFLGVGCATRGAFLKEIDQPVVEIRSAINEAMGDPEVTSENGRELKSKFYPRNPDPKFASSSAAERFFAQVSILGDRRPYRVNVQVFRQVKAGNGYSSPKLDEKKSYEMALSIQGRLNHGRDKRNFIDDFRPF